MNRSPNILFVQFSLKGLNVFYRNRCRTRCLPDAKHAKRTHFKSGGIGILQLGIGSHLAAEGTLNDRLESGLSPRGKGLRLDQEIIGKNKSRFHDMVDRMAVRLAVKFPNLVRAVPRFPK
jgi:hypothetical protein